MSPNTKDDIPYKSGIDTNRTALDLPDLPEPWEWGSVNHLEMTNKVNLFFGYDLTEVGGKYGEIDNYREDGEEEWGLHIRPIVVDPSNPHGCRPRKTAETSKTYDTLDAAIRAAPGIIGAYY